MYGQYLNFIAADQAEAAMKKINSSNELIQESSIGDNYVESLMESKLEKDATFLTSLGKDLEDKDEFYENIETLLEGTLKLFREIDVKPRTCSAAVDNQLLDESTIVNIYGKNMTKGINKEFTKPLSDGKLLEENRELSKMLLESTI